MGDDIEQDRVHVDDSEATSTSYRRRIVGPVSPNAAAKILDMPVVAIWQQIQSGQLKAVFLPNGMTHVKIEVD